MRTLIGKLHEAWDLFRARVLSDRSVAALYLPKLNADANAALESLKRHFGTQSPLTLIRNRFSFHYKDDWDLVEESFQEVPDDESWQFYLSNIHRNSFFYASELVVAGGVIKLANQTPDPMEPYLAASARSFAALCHLINEVSAHIQTLFGESITEIVSHSLDSSGRCNKDIRFYASHRSSVSAGVFQPSVFRGRALGVAATAASVSALCTLRSVPLGKYWRSSPLVFSLAPRCQGL